MRVCKRCQVGWSSTLGDVACWFCEEQDSEDVWGTMTSTQMVPVKPLPDLPGDPPILFGP